MRSAVLYSLLALSLLLNGVLWRGITSSAARAAVLPVAVARPGEKQAAAKPKLAWMKLYSEDLNTFTTNLRAAGMPEWQVRIWIEARINELYAEREAALKPAKEERGWWQRDKVSMPFEKQWALFDLAREKTKLRISLLGPRDMSDNPICDHLPPEKREMAQMIVDGYGSLLGNLRGEFHAPMLTAAEREKTKLMQEEMDRELSSLLTPEEIAEHKMRTSRTTESLRFRWGSFEATEDEYREIYKIQKRQDDKGRYSVADELRIAAELKQSLGEKRGTEAARAISFDYRELRQLVLRSGLHAETADQVYDVRDSLAAETKRLASDSSLSQEEKLAAAKALAEKTRIELNAKLGPVLAPIYMKSSEDWLRWVEQGHVITFSSSSYSTVTPEQYAAQEEALRAKGGEMP